MGWLSDAVYYSLVHNTPKEIADELFNKVVKEREYLNKWYKERMEDKTVLVPTKEDYDILLKFIETNQRVFDFQAIEVLLFGLFLVFCMLLFLL